MTDFLELLFFFVFIGILVFFHLRDIRKNKPHFGWDVSLPKGVPCVDEREAYLEWAFGENPRVLGNVKAIKEWNKRHGDKFYISDSDFTLDKDTKMMDLYAEHVREKIA